jgi:hypothetical protein
MAWWDDEVRWVSEGGLRCYFVASDWNGPSRLECYRRILSQSDAVGPMRRGTRFAGLGRRLTNLGEIVNGGWRRYPSAIATMLQIVGQ